MRCLENETESLKKKRMHYEDDASQPNVMQAYYFSGIYIIYIFTSCWLKGEVKKKVFSLSVPYLKALAHVRRCWFKFTNDGNSKTRSVFHFFSFVRWTYWCCYNITRKPHVSASLPASPHSFYIILFHSQFKTRPKTKKKNNLMKMEAIRVSDVSLFFPWFFSRFSFSFFCFSVSVVVWCRFLLLLPVLAIIMPATGFAALCYRW